MVLELSQLPTWAKQSVLIDDKDSQESVYYKCKCSKQLGYLTSKIQAEIAPVAP
jgi:hypothetical protein